MVCCQTEISLCICAQAYEKIPKHVYTFSRLRPKIFLSNLLWYKIVYPRSSDMLLSIQIDNISHICKYDDRNWSSAKRQSFVSNNQYLNVLISSVVASHHGQYILENDLFYICVQNITISFLLLEKIMATYNISETNL